MSTTKTFAALLAISASPCSTSSNGGGNPTSPSYTCQHAFDAGCGYQAQVQITGGTLTSASILPIGLEGSASSGTFEQLAGTVTITDVTGAEPVITCDFEVDLVLQADTQAGRAVVTSSVGSTVFDAACPLSCAWFLPPGGDFDAGSGHFRLTWFESQWELQFGASEPGAEEVGPVWLWTGPSGGDVGFGVELIEPAEVLGGSYALPLDAPPDSYPDLVCP